MKNILHLFGIHDWEINEHVTRQGKHMYFIRECQICGKTQLLGKPFKYHPSAWVWLDN